MVSIFDNFDSSSLFNDNYGTIGNAANNYILNGTDSTPSLLSTSISDYINSPGNASGSMNWGNLLKNSGRYANALGTGIAAFQNQQRPNYRFTTQWLGNGLARTNMIDEERDKQNKLNQIFGAGDYINSLFKGGMGGTGTLEQLPVATSIYGDYGDLYGIGNTPVSNAINNYMRK